MTKQQVSVIVLPTSDLEESLAFYTQALGFPLVRRFGSNYAIVDAGSVSIGLSASSEPPTGRKNMLGMKTDDVDALAKQITGSGGTIVTAPHDDGDERRAFVLDNKGNLLMIYKR